MEIKEIEEMLDSLYSHNENEKAYHFLKEQLTEAMSQNRDDKVLFLLSELMGYYRVTSQFELGNKMAIQAIKILTHHGLEDSIAAATTYLNIATLYRVQGQYSYSLMMYKKCEQIYSEHLNPNDERYASFYNNVSLLYQETGEYEQAIDYELKALSIIEKIKNCEVEQAITYTNLSAMYNAVNNQDEAKKCLNKAIALFKIFGVNDPHYYAVLSLKAESLYHDKEYSKAIDLYDEVLDGIEKNYGKSKEYYIVQENKDRVIEEYKNNHIKGLELCYQYYLKHGKKMLAEKFPQFLSYMAIGLFGYGSDCLGYDDDISVDHDFGPGFVVLLPFEIYRLIGESIQKEYDLLPKEFMGMKRIESNHGKMRVGVYSIEQFFGQFISKIPNHLNDWLLMDEKALLNCTNGVIFDDYLGEVTKIRDILEYYPEDIRIKHIANSIAKIAQSGQYNYARCMRRKDEVAASLALNEFVDQTLSCIYLLNKKYKPYYKWSFKGLKDSYKLSDVKELLEELVLLPSQKEVWSKDVTGINYNDKKVILIERICQKIIYELRNQNLTDSFDDFLENHVMIVNSHIQDNDIRSS